MTAADRARAALDALQQHEGIRAARWVWGASRKLVDLQTPGGAVLLRGLDLPLAQAFMGFLRDAFALADAVGELLEEHDDEVSRSDTAELDAYTSGRKVAHLEAQLQRHDEEHPAEAWARKRFAESRPATSEAERLARTTLDRKVMS